MSPVDLSIKVSRSHFYTVFGRFFGVQQNKLPTRDISMALPATILCSNGRLNELFLPPVAKKIVQDIFPDSGRTADELITELKRENLTAVEPDLGSVYHAILRERETVIKLAENRRKMLTSTSRLKALMEMVHGLGLKSNENQKVATGCIRGGLGFSGVRLYTIEVKTGKWLHLYAEGEEGVSNFNERKEPKPNSEKAFLNRLLRSEVPQEEIDRARAEGLFEWHLNGEWGYFYIPERSRCAFVDAEQLRKDEQGDPTQQRNGYGAGAAREILYLIFGKRDQEEVEIYMVTNWRSRRALFTDKEQDLELLHTFAKALVSARQHVEDHQKVIEETVHDPLTGIHNRRYFERKLNREIKRSMRWTRPISVGYLDIDWFKRINDTYGHEFGDLVLKRVAQIMKDSERIDVDAACRIGGEEFAIILPATGHDGKDAARVMERIRERVEAETFRYNNPLTGETIEVKATISGGVSYFESPTQVGDRIKTMQPEEFSEFVEQTGMVLKGRADKALYDAKETGRNRIEIYQKPVK